MKLYDDKFMSVASPILENINFLEVKKFKHHEGSVYDHVLNVAYSSYLISYKFNLDWESTIRGALLHDFFLYKFQKYLGIKLPIDVFKHVKDHPIMALENAEKYFDLNKKERDIIKNHMFPMRVPKCRESWIVSFVDKYVAIYEYSRNFYKIFTKRYIVATDNNSSES